MGGEAGEALDAVDEAQGVARRMGPIVVVEVDEDVGGRQPLGDLSRPVVELGVGVAAAVETRRSVQPHIGEIGAAMERARKLSGAVGGDQRDAVLAQNFD
jgi:hypothetical protein